MMDLLALEDEYDEVLKQIEQNRTQETASEQGAWRLVRFARKADSFARPWILQFK
jgi:hypothetical protein